MNDSRQDELESMFDKLDKIRKDLVDCKKHHIKTLTDLGMSKTEAIKDWRNNFKNILDSMDYCTREIRNIVLGKK